MRETMTVHFIESSLPIEPNQRSNLECADLSTAFDLDSALMKKK
jgi:hypothetical protein